MLAKEEVGGLILIIMTIYQKILLKEINYYIENGAKYFVPMKGWIHNDKGEYRKYLEENFKKIIDEDGYYIYVLQ